MAAKPKSMVGVDALLPPEIWTEILTRVPVKSVFRCRFVCKSLYSLISCPSFISDHSVKNLNKNGKRALLRLQNPAGWSYSSQDESSMEFTAQHGYIPEAFRGPFVEIVGSCHGLICLSNARNRFSGRSYPIAFLLWNPTIRKIVELPSRLFCPPTQRMSYCGFGFDSKTNDYKVLRVVGNTNMNGAFCDVMCKIFYLRKGVWRVIYPRAPSSWFIGVRNIPECYLDGNVYWGYRSVLLSFSFSNECFREIEMPNFAKSVQNDSYAYNTRTQSVNGLIYVIMWTGHEDCSVWKMREYGVTESWTKVFTIEPHEFQYFRTINLTSLVFWKNDNVLMFHNHTGNHQDLVSYNRESRELKILFSGYFSKWCLYEESLVLM